MDPNEHRRLAEFEEGYWWHRGRQTIVRRILQHYSPPGARILDVGCGTGATTASLRRFGRVAATDLGAEALRVARRRDLAVVRARASRLPFRRAGIDVVVCLDVLEHLDDDVGAAREMYAVLRPGGILLATVPAYSFLWSRHDEALGHRRRYSRAQLTARLRRGGFEIERCSYVMSSILPLAMAVRLAERWRPVAARRRQSGYIRLPAPLNSSLAWLVALGGYLVPWFNLPFGLSVVAVARRPRPESGSASGS